MSLIKRRFENVQGLLANRNEGLGTFNVLPDDVLFLLLRNLNVAELLKCKRLSWLFYRAALHNRVWEAQIIRLERFYPQIHDLTVTSKKTVSLRLFAERSLFFQGAIC